MRQEKKSGGTKRALLTSVLALVLTLAMLVGSTFAWFTDTASTGVNRIVSGNLDVGLEYWDKESGWLDAEDSKDLFDENALWEPGYTQIVYLKVNNNGNLALTYAMQITPVHEQLGINVGGEEFKLSDYIQFGWAVITAGEDGTFQFADRDAARTAVGEGVHLGKELRRQAELPLEAGAEELVALVAWMPENVGNEANYRHVAPSIELSLKVLATQATVESDSFDNMYDEGAAEDELKDLPTYDYSYSELDGIILIPNENGDIVKAIVTEKAGKVPESYFNNEKFAKLSEVEIQEGVTEIEGSAFARCTVLEKITIPGTVKKIGSWAFYRCENLKSVTIPDGTEIEASAFRLSGLEDVTVTGGSIGDYAFHRSNLKNAVIDCETVGKEAFSGCDCLESVTLTDNVKNLGDAVFYTCDVLKSIEIPSSVTSLGRSAFKSCIGLESAVIKGGTVFGRGARDGTFYNCNKLKTLIISDNGKMDSTFKGTDVQGLETLEVYGGVIGAGAFRDHAALTTVIVGENVTSIGDRAFGSGQKLKEATIETEAMDGCIFYNCKVLDKVTFGDTVETIPAKLFNYCAAMQAGGAIYVKPGTWNFENKNSITIGDDGLIPAENVITITKGNGMSLTYVTTP